MGSIGGPEILVILVVALLVLGPERLPRAARDVGRAIGELRRTAAGFQAEFRDALDEPRRAPAPPASEPDRPAPEPDRPAPEPDRPADGSVATRADGDGRP